ncbi:hypothetical protein XELAEV_18009361mg [Xenopus laevis]|uniref:Uncharacterized protein n=1 Tax=Xenopus laevis TaxID=8355 RepID=A0A974DSK8_XENLA|nr:hypothetical protein XELAEV_18009361mg [Xenopus laevis]
MPPPPGLTAFLRCWCRVGVLGKAQQRNDRQEKRQRRDPEVAAAAGRRVAPNLSLGMMLGFPSSLYPSPPPPPPPPPPPLRLSARSRVTAL